MSQNIENIDQDPDPNMSPESAGNESSVGDENVHIPGNSSTLNQNNIEMDNMLEQVFGNDLYEPRNAMFLITAQKIEIQDYKRQLKESQNQVQELTEAYKKLYVEKKQLGMQKHKMKTVMENIEECGKQFKEYYNNAVDKFNDLDTFSKNLKTKYDFLENQVAGSTVSKTKYDEIKKELDEWKKSYIDLQEKDEDLKKEICQLRDQITLLMNENTAKVTKYQEQLTKKDEEFQQRQQEYETQVNNMVKQLQENFQEMDNRCKSAEHQLQDKTEALTNIQRKVEQQMQDINQLREQNNRLSNEKDQIIQGFQNEMSNKNQEIVHLRSDYERQLNEMVSELNGIKTQLTEVNANQNKQLTENRILNEQLILAKEENSKYQQTNIQLITELNDLKSGLKLEESKTNEMKRQYEKLGKEIAELKNQAVDFNRRELEYQKKITELECENKSMKKFTKEIENRPFQQRYSTPTASNVPPESIGLSPISIGSDVSKQKKVENKEVCPVLVAPLAVASVKPRFFATIKPPGAKTQGKSVTKVKLDSSVDSVGPSTPASNQQPSTSQLQSSDMDMVDINPNDMSRHIGPGDFDSDSESIEVKIIKKEKKKN